MDDDKRIPKLLDVNDVLRVAHETANSAFDEFIGMDANAFSTDLYYLWGIHEMTRRLLEYMGAKI